MPRPPEYGIIYNWDGAPYGYSEVPQSMESYLDKTYAPLENTQVKALFWSIRDHASFGESEPASLLSQSAAAYTSIENVRLMKERGEDSNAALIQRGHELGLQVYASMRMNDNHFGGAQVGDLDGMGDASRVRLRREHPEWLLGDRTSEWFALSWDMSVPEIRQRRLAHIEEICRPYDWDGVELDWQRHGFHFPDDYGYRLRYTLTDLQRAVRRMTDELSERRGKPFYLAARVSGTLEMCRRIGYDIPVWVEEGLVDILIPAGGAATDPSIDVASFRDLCKGTDVVVYPGFDGGLPGPHVGPEDAFTKDLMRTRAIANHYHKAGSDGIYVFNWHANRDSRRELLTEIGTADTLRGKDKVYAATHRFIQKEGEWRGAYRNDRIWGEVPVPLKRTLTGDGPTITLDIADDLTADTPERVELRLLLQDWVKGDVVRVFWDGAEIDTLETRYHIVTDPHANPLAAAISDVGSAVWLYSEMAPGQVGRGLHQIKAVLSERVPRLESDIVLTDAELVISYGKD